MNNKLTENLTHLEGLIGIQRGCLNDNRVSLEYMRGLLNGLICAHSVFTGDTPRYESRPKKSTITKIRHKNRRNK